MADPGFQVNCPACGAALKYVRTEDGTHVYACPRDGRVVLPPDGIVRVKPH
jgi:uncharacterized C2H2 Zn-finger protein